MATLTFADAGNGTGGTATIAGSPAGSSSSVLAQQQLASGGVWSLAGQRTGDGTVSLPLAVGSWWLQLQTVASGVLTVAPIVAALVTNLGTAPHDRCLSAVQTIVQGQSLSGLPASQVYYLIHRDDKRASYPGIFISYADLRESVKILDSEGRKEIGYGVKVEVCERSDGDYTTNKGRFLLWRWQLMEALRFQGGTPMTAPALPGVPECWKTTIEPGYVAQVERPKYQILVADFTVRCGCIETG